MVLIDLSLITDSDFLRLKNDELFKAILPKKLRYLQLIAHIADLEIAKMAVLSLDSGKISLTEIQAQINSVFITDWMEIVSPGKVIQSPKQEICDDLESLFHSGHRALLLRSFPATDFSGYAWINRHNEVVVESCLGGFYGLWTWECIPSRYILKDGEIVFRKITTTDKFYTFDYQKRKWICRDRINSSHSMIGDDLLLKIESSTVKLEGMHQKLRIEWLLSNEKLSLFDLGHASGEDGMDL